MSFARNTLLSAAVVLAASAVALTAANNGARGAVVQSGGDRVPHNPSLPKLNLSAAQREQVRQMLRTEHTEVQFKRKETQAAKDFSPKVGAKLPTQVKPLGVPSELIRQIPQLADYGYTKMKDQILIVNGMSGQIVEIIPETQSQTTGQQ